MAGRGHDLRMGLVGLAAWAGGLSAGLLPPGVALAACLVVAAGTGWVAVRSPRRRTTVLGCALVLVAVAGVGLLRSERVAGDPVAELARDRAAVTGRMVVTSDPRPMVAARSDGVVLQAQVREVTGRGTTWAVRAPVLVIAPASWGEVALGSEVALSGRLDAPEAGERHLSAVLVVSGPLTVLERPDAWWRATAALRASLRDSVAHRPSPERVLVPALVAGDDAGLDPAVAEEFRATGLTHEKAR